MIKSIRIASLFFLCVLAACGSQSSSNPTPATSDRCSDELINTWNAILTESKKPARERKIEVVQASCEKFKTLLGTGTCKTWTDKSRVIEISAHTVEGFCPDREVVVNPTPAPNPDPVQPPPPVAPASPKLKEMTKGFHIIVRDEEAFFDLFSSGSEAVIQEGRIAHGSLQVIPGKSLCHAQKTDDFGDIRIGDEWEFPAVLITTSTDNKVTFIHQNKKLGFICAKAGAEDWTLADLTAVFGSKATIQVVQ